MRIFLAENPFCWTFDNIEVRGSWNIEREGGEGKRMNEHRSRLTKSLASPAYISSADNVAYDAKNSWKTMLM